MSSPSGRSWVALGKAFLPICPLPAGTMSSVRGCYTRGKGSVRGKGSARGRGKVTKGLCPPTVLGVGARVAARRILEKQPQIDDEEEMVLSEEDTMEEDIPVQQEVVAASQNPSTSRHVDVAVSNDVVVATQNPSTSRPSHRNSSTSVNVEDGEHAANNVDSSTSSRARGMNHGIDEPANEKDRVQVELLRDGSFRPSTVVRTISVLLKEYMTETRWMHVPQHIRKLLWTSFEGRYAWKEPTTKIQRAFFFQMQDSHASTLHDARKKAMEIHGKTDIIETKGLSPEWMRTEIWDKMVDKWSSEDWKKKSVAAKKNRLTEKDGGITKHTCGSIPITEHELRLEKKMGYKPSDEFIFNYLHTKRGRDGTIKEYIDGKSKRVAESYFAAYTDKYGYEPTPDKEFDVGLWVDAVGVSTRGRLYGFGESKLMTSSSRGETSSETTSQSQLDIGQIREELRQEVREELRQEMLQLNEDFGRKLQEDMEKKLQEMLLQQAQGRNAPAGESSSRTAFPDEED